MKNWKLHVVVVAAMVCGAWILKDAFAQPAAPAAPADTRVAVCDVVQVFNHYQKSQDLSAKLTERRRQAQAEDEQRRKEIGALEMELEALKEGSPEYNKRVDRMQDLVIQREVWKKVQEGRIMKEHHRLTKEIYDEILSVIGALARERKFQIVIYSQRGTISGKNTPELLRMIELRKVLYSEPGLDLTDAVVGKLNGAYRAKGG